MIADQIEWVVVGLFAVIGLSLFVAAMIAYDSDDPLLMLRYALAMLVLGLGLAWWGWK